MTPTFGTSTTLGQDVYKKGMIDQAKLNQEKTPQQLCKEKGGTWDAVTQTCLLPQPKQPEAPKQEVITKTFDSPMGKTTLTRDPENRSGSRGSPNRLGPSYNRRPC